MTKAQERKLLYDAVFPRPKTTPIQDLNEMIITMEEQERYRQLQFKKLYNIFNKLSQL